MHESTESMTPAITARFPELSYPTSLNLVVHVVPNAWCDHRERRCACGSDLKARIYVKLADSPRGYHFCDACFLRMPLLLVSELK